MTQKHWDEKQTAEWLNVSLSKLRSDRFKGVGIPYVKIGRSVRYDVEDVTRFIDGCKIRHQDHGEGG